MTASKLRESNDVCVAEVQSAGGEEEDDGGDARHLSLCSGRKSLAAIFVRVTLAIISVHSTKIVAHERPVRFVRQED
jgi:hypothetical protein